MKCLKWAVPLFSLTFFIYSCQVFKNIGHKNKNSSASNISQLKESPGRSPSDTTKKASVSKPKIYKEVITAKAITDSGLFTVHRIDERYFFEIPDSLLERDILIVNRIAKGAANIKPNGSGYAGDQIGENVIIFSKGPKDKLFIKMVSYSERSFDSSENGMYRTVKQSNVQPIVVSFEIKAYTPDSSGSVIDLTDFLNSDNALLYFKQSVKKDYGLGALQKDKSYISGIQSFPINVELRAVNTYFINDETATFELNTSFVMLPKEAMKPRYRDERIGYFGRGYIDYDAPKGVDITWMITRWRIEPRKGDEEKYLRGELVEPQNPIVYFIDPATPKKWIPYLIQGVDDWQKAFEKAGFKNAIYALESPVNDPEWNLYDARHSAIVYKPSPIANASGPHVHDPRTGEILETHINWYHNIQQILHDWYMVQAGPNDPRARKMVFDDCLMGELIRYVVCHEVGNTLGLMHNFGASSTVPVDSLRSKSYVETNGFCPSIMDYARFNYVAQPEDNISEKGIMPRIGVYDEWAIEWGYKWLPKLRTQKEEKAFMNSWIIDRVKKDKRLWFATDMTIVGSLDPRNQKEDIGDDAMKAGYYGIKNLKRIVPSLLEWTNEPNKNYESATAMQSRLIFFQYYNYLQKVISNIGGLMTNVITREQKGVVYDFASREKQQAAVQFLQDELFTTPEWFISSKLFPYTGTYAAGGILSIQKAVLYNVVSNTNFDNMTLCEKMYPSKRTYSFSELLGDLEVGIWSELRTKKLIDTYRRDLQKSYAERLINHLSINRKVGSTSSDYLSLPSGRISDFCSIIKAHSRKIISEINKALPYYKNDATRWHLIDVQERLQRALEPNVTSNSPTPNTPATLSEGFNDRGFGVQLFPWFELLKREGENVRKYQSCWEDYGSFMKY